MEEQIYRQPRRNGKTWILVVAAVAVLLLCGVAFVLTANRLSLSVELNGEPEMMLEYGGHFQDPGAQLRVRGSLLWKDGMSPQDASVGVQGKVDEGKPGKYILTYEADYRGMHAEAQRIVRIVDTVCPEIILTPDSGGTLLPGTPYREAGYKAIDNYDGVITEESHITTPEVLELYQHFQNAYDSGISHLVMEVSSQALKVGRVRGMTFDVGAFLNIGTDHISPIEHPDFADYYASKLKLFDSCRVGCVNTDAKYAERVIEYAKGRCELITFGSHASDTVFCERVEKRADGLYFTVRSPKYNGEFSITMPGLFNVSNALAAMAISMALGVPEEFVRSGLRKARANGRMQVYESRDKRVTVIVDYAHNRMSFDALYRSTRVEYPGKEMISVFGCPGSHALQRRRDLGELSGENCAFVYITEEDSGEEPFAQIAADIEKHVKCPHLVCEDRAECIRRAILDHPEPHVILLTGKGEETTMKRGREFVPFPSDVELTLRYLAEYDEKEAKA